MPVSSSTETSLKRKLSESEFELHHPLGILPLGNSYFDPLGNSVRTQGLGSFAVFEDELILEILGYLDTTPCLELASKALYAFSCHEELWRERCIDGNRLDFVGTSWRSTFLGKPLEASVQVRLYSDVLYYPVRCRRAFADLFNRKFPDKISRLTKAQAQTTALTKPVLITDAVSSWGAWKLWSDRKYLLSKCGECLLACNGALMTLSQFFRYQRGLRGRMEEVGLFVFENKFFGESELLGDFRHEWEIFGSDLFDLLSPPYRPDNRWLLIASQGTFSQWHIDPNSTSAWNGVIAGRKLWLLLPPSCAPCGVFASADGTAVKQPKSLYEWFASGLYAETKQLYGRKLVEAVCGPGELIFVPRGWWHCVVNLDDTVAVTQNFVQAKHVHLVRRFLRESVQCVSGVECEFRPDLWRVFDEQLKVHHPEFFRGDLANEAGPSEANDVRPNEGGETQERFSFWSHLMSSNSTLDYSKSL